MASGTATLDDFVRLDVRVGTVRRAEENAGARKPALQLWIDFGGDIGLKRSSAQITRHYTGDDLIGRQVVAVINLPSRQVGKVLSEVLVLGFPDESGDVVLIGPDRPVPDGGRLY